MSNNPLSLRRLLRIFPILTAVAGLISCDAGRLVDGSSSAPIRFLRVFPRAATLATGDTIRLTATATTADGQTVQTAVTWESLDTAVATISTSGLLQARRPGHARAVGRAKEGGVADSAEVTVHDPGVYLTGIAVRPENVTLVAGGAQAFAAVGLLSDGSETSAAVAWTSTGGQVDANGHFTAGATPGTFQIIAVHAAGFADTASIIVAPARAVAGIRVTPAQDTLTVGATLRLQAQVVDSTGASLSGMSVGWSSSNPLIAAVDTGGQVTGRTAGSVLIVAAVSGFTDTATIVVRAPDPSIYDQRPYTVDSPWNTRIPAGATVDPNSAAMIATIAASSTGKLRSDPTQYAYPVYFADASTPRVTLSCSGYVSVIELDGSRTLQQNGQLTGVPIPAGATPSEGSDGQIIVIDLQTGDEYDIWRFQSPSTCENATRYVRGIHRSAVEPNYGSRGAGVPYLAGLIRPWEIAAGRIDHALAFGYPLARLDRCVWPASKTDGDDDRPDAIPQGARLRLDPTLNVNDIPGLDAAGRIIARALQEYGMILIDNSGSNKIYLEDSLTAGWGTQIVATTVGAIPVDRLQVLSLPASYWAATYTPTHGRCVR